MRRGVHQEIGFPLPLSCIDKPAINRWKNMWPKLAGTAQAWHYGHDGYRMTNIVVQRTRAYCVSCEFHASQAALDQPHARPTQDCVCGSQVVPGRQKSCGLVPRFGQLGDCWARLILAQIIIKRDMIKSFVMCISRVCEAAVLRRLINSRVIFLCVYFVLGG